MADEKQPEVVMPVSRRPYAPQRVFNGRPEALPPVRRCENNSRQIRKPLRGRQFVRRRLQQGVNARIARDETVARNDAFTQEIIERR